MTQLSVIGVRTIVVVVVAAAALAIASPAIAGPPANPCLGPILPSHIRGGAGPDVLTGDGGANVIWGLGGDDIIHGGNGNDILCGGPGNDQLFGEGGNDQLFGSGESDRLAGGRNADRLVGGPSVDKADYSGHSIPVRVTIDGLANDGVLGEGDNVELTVENLIGGRAGDFLTGHTQSAVSNALVGGPGDDVLNGLAGVDRLNGEAGSDFLFGGPGLDWLFGSAGADLLEGGSEPDEIVGGEGPDRLRGGMGNESALLCEAIPFQGSIVWLCPSISGGAGNDTFVAEAGPDDGADKLAGGNGIDTADYSARATPVQVVLDNNPRDGHPVLDERDFVQPDIENVVTGSGNDFLRGSAGNNRLTGNAGQDTLAGGAGADVLIGGTERDELYHNVDVFPSPEDNAKDVLDCGLPDAPPNQPNAGDMYLIGGFGDTQVGCEWRIHETHDD